MDLSKINSFLSSEAQLVSMRDLTPGELYEIHEIKEINTKFGKSLIVTSLQNKFFLPKRVYSRLHKNIDELNRGGYSIKFLGVEDPAKQNSSCKFTIEKN